MFFSTLSGRFLTLTAVFVVIAEVLFFVPSMARFRYDYLQARLDLGQMAALTVLAMPPDQEVPADLQQKLLDAAGVLNIALRRNDVRELMVSSPTPPMVQGSYNLLTDTSLDLMHDALRVFLRGGDRIVRVIGSTSQGGEVEITMHEQPLREAMVKQGAPHPLHLARHLARHRDAALSRRAAPHRPPDQPRRHRDDHLPRRPRGTRAGSSPPRAAPARSARPRPPSRTSRSG